MVFFFDPHLNPRRQAGPEMLGINLLYKDYMADNHGDWNLS